MTQGMSIKLPARSRSGELSFCLGVAAHKILTFPDPDGKRIKFRIAWFEETGVYNYLEENSSAVLGMCEEDTHLCETPWVREQL